MPLRLNVGVNKKMGLPDYGSLGTSCNVEVEVDGCLIFDDLEAFHRKVRQAYVACAQAVNDELDRQSAPTSQTAPQTSHQTHSAPPSGTATTNGHGPGNGMNGSRASKKQLDYANQLVGQIQGLGAHRLELLADEMFDKPIAELSRLDASALIDTLKAVKEDRLDLNTTFNGALS
ncbi:MAG: hypothetical protein QGG09_19455 [Pirellulaceae bacterium]|nr:hypothetical protein [Pirellulaceae bacterium]HJN09227.1 hypothetical protein [Pirellulaceae bacterium]